MISTNQQKWLSFSTVAVGTFMATLDSSIVNVSLPTIAGYFKTNLAQIEWVVLAYLLTITSLLLQMGRWADLIGRSRVYATGFLLFTLGSMFCGIAQTAGMLIYSRILQAVGAAMIMATGPAIITHAFPREELGRGMGLAGSIVSIGLMTGPPLGGFLVDALGWRSIFYVNLPVGALGFYLAFTILPKDRRGERVPPFDWWGAVSIISFLTGLLYALNHGTEWGWTSPNLIFFLSGSVIVGVFIFLFERTHPAPLLDFSLFQNRTFTAGNIAGTLMFMALFMITFFMPFYLEHILGYSPRHVGMALMMIPITNSFISPLSGILSDRFGKRKFTILGLLIASGGIFFLSRLSDHSGFLRVVIPLMVLGMGIGIFQAPNNSSIMSHVPRHQLGVGGSMLSVVRTFGMVLGIAIGGAFFSLRLSHYSGQNVAERTFDSSLNPSFFINSFNETFILATGVCFFAVAITYFLKENELSRKE